jgi:hypothetical protein
MHLLIFDQIYKKCAYDFLNFPQIHSSMNSIRVGMILIRKHAINPLLATLIDDQLKRNFS